MSTAQLFGHEFGAFDQESVGPSSGTSSGLLKAADVVVYLLIVGFTVLQFVLNQRAAELYTGDTVYIEPCAFDSSGGRLSIQLQA